MVSLHVSSDHLVNYLLQSCHQQDKPASIAFFNYLDTAFKKMIVQDLCHLSNINPSDHDWIQQHSFDDLSKVASVVDHCARKYFTFLPQEPEKEVFFQKLHHPFVVDLLVDQENTRAVQKVAFNSINISMQSKLGISLEELFLHHPFLLKYEENKDRVLQIVASDGWAFKYVNDFFKNDKDVALVAVKNTYGLAFEFVGSSLKNDKDFAKVVIFDYNHRCALKFLHDDLKDDQNLMQAALALDGLSLKYASKRLQNDRDFVLFAVMQNGTALEFASKDLQNDTIVVTAAVSKNGEALEFASTDLQNEKSIVMIAAAENEEALHFSGQDLRNDRSFVLDGISKFTSMLKFAGHELKKDRTLVLSAIEKNALVLAFASEEIRNDKEIVLAAVTQNGMALEFASDLLKQDKDVVLSAIASCSSGRAFSFASDALKNHKEIVLEAVLINGLAIEYASTVFRSDKDVMLMASLQNAEAFQYASYLLQNDIKFIHQIFSKNLHFFSEISEEFKSRHLMNLIDFHIAGELNLDQIKDLKTKIDSCEDEDLEEFFLHRLVLTSSNRLKYLFCNDVFTEAQSKDLMLLLLVIESLPVDEDAKKDFIDLIKCHYKSLFKDRIKRDRLSHCFLQICKGQNHISSCCMRLLVAMRLNKKNQLMDCILILSILAEQNREKLIALQDHQLHGVFLVNLLLGDLQRQGILLPGEENLSIAASIFLQYRNPTALLTYAYHFLTSKKMKNSIFQFTRSVMQGTFLEERYAKSPNIQMLSDHHKQIWMTPLAKEEIISIDKDKKLDLRRFFYEKLVIDGHGKDRVNGIVSYLKNPTDQAEVGNPLEAAILSLFSLDQDLLLNGLMAVYKILKEPKYVGLELINDIKGVIEHFRKNSSSAKVFLDDSDDHQDLFLCGSEVTGSCQRVDGEPYLNRCLMGYVLDGKVRLLAVKDDKGVIISRAILKLLYDRDKKPVLFFERVYGDMRYQSALEMYARQKAKSMQLSLFSAGKGPKLESFGNVAPYEYEDGGVGVSKGVYVISGKAL
jgi:hypothetical protein